MQTKSRSCPVCRTNHADLFSTVDGFDVVRCRECRFVYVDIDADYGEEINEYKPWMLYAYYANEPIYTMAFYDDSVNSIERLSPPGKLRILDFGCGTGMFMRRARKRGHDVVGVDFSPYAEMARDMFNLNIYCQDLASCDIELESFDVIVSHATYEHLMDPVGITKELLKYLKPGGLFIISGVPNFSAFAIQVFKNFYRNGLGHVNHFEKESLSLVFQTCGIEPIRIYGYGLAIWWLIDKFRGLKTRENSSWPDFSETGALETKMLRDYDVIEPSLLQRIISRAYQHAPPAYLSLSLEAWGRKSLR
ncbi:MAG: hypothetical protein RL594_788 [Bacteroidota bacterium]|jgi:SAM-dependent methyltransferase